MAAGYIISDPVLPGGMNVDPTFNAARASVRPLDHGIGGSLLGHYCVGQLSGSIAATPTALDAHASFRWAPSLGTALAVIERIRVGWTVLTAITTAVPMAYQATIARSFTVDFTTASTAINLGSVTKTQAMRSNMGSSLLGTAGPRISTTTVMTGKTYTLDTGPIGYAVWNPTQILTGTVSMPAACAGEMKALYECNDNGQHPIVLANNEGVIVQIVNTGWATGTIGLYVEWTWCEVSSY